MTHMTKGCDLCLPDQRHVLSAYVHRFTVKHVPEWATSGNYKYYPQFEDDADWLANSEFYVKADGTLDMRHRGCLSHPTWPQGKGINGQKGVDW